MRKHALTGSVIARLEAHDTRTFADRGAFSAHLGELGIDQLDVHPDPVKIATEAALWGSINHHGLLNDTVIVSDGAGQFRVGQHGLCWVHAERPQAGFNDSQRRAIDQVFYAPASTIQNGPSILTSVKWRRLLKARP
ncbi:MAG: hypothetical protein R3C70_13945 [Geminicoccaceae bacterium]